jgi:hypothetical protein
VTDELTFIAPRQKPKRNDKLQMPRDADREFCSDPRKGKDTLTMERTMKRLSLSIAAIVVATGLTASPVIAAQSATVTNDLSAATKTVKKTTRVHTGHAGNTVRRSTTVRKSSSGNVSRRTTVTRTRNNTVVVRRPYRAWAHRPYYGTAIIGGVALGTVIAVSAAHAYPAAPGPNACWFWSDPTETRGYWDYCTPP